MNFSKVNEVLNKVGQRSGIKNFQLAENGCTGLTLKDGVLISFEWQAAHESLYIYTSLLELTDSAERQLSLCLSLLRYNCVNAGAVVTLHPDTQEALLQIQLRSTLVNENTVEQAVAMLLEHKNTLLNTLQAKALSPHFTQRTTPYRALPSL